jgi:hypothetical protein
MQRLFRACINVRVAHAGNERVNESVISVIKIHNSFSIFDKRHLIHLSFFVPYHIFDVCAYGVRLVLSPFGARTRRENNANNVSRERGSTFTDKGIFDKLRFIGPLRSTREFS